MVEQRRQPLLEQERDEALALLDEITSGWLRAFQLEYDPPSLADDALFVSEVRVALYLLPALFAGLGINVISHVLTTHLVAAEKRFAEQQKDEAKPEV